MFDIKLSSNCFLGYLNMTVSLYASTILLNALLLKCGDIRVLELLAKAKKPVQGFLFFSNTQFCKILLLADDEKNAI